MGEQKTTNTLFADLFEARTFRNPQTLEKYSKQELSEIFFLFMMILNLMAHVDPTVAKKYAADTLQYPSFATIKLSATDLCNLITALYRADAFLDEKSVPLPILEIKRWLRGFSNAEADLAFTRMVLMKCQTVLKISDSMLLRLRRNVTDFSVLDTNEQLDTARQLYRLIRKSSYNGDLIILFHAWLEKTDV